MKNIGQILFGNFSKATSEDYQLVSLVIEKGDQAAFEQLVNRYKSKLYKFIYFQVNNSQDAEDLLQDTFVELYKSIDRFNKESQFNSYLYAIAKNIVFNYYRTKSRRVTTSQDIDVSKVIGGSCIQQTFETSETVLQMQQAINQLNVEERQILYLCDKESMSYQQISVILDINLGTVRSRLHNIRKRIIDLMSENKDELQ